MKEEVVMAGLGFKTFETLIVTSPTAFASGNAYSKITLLRTVSIEQVKLTGAKSKNR